jgi:hypothetical protein
MWMHPASVTAAKQPRPLLVTMVLGSKLALAHLAIASDVNPLTKSSLSRVGCPASSVEIAAKKGALFSELFPGSPPERSPPT